MEPICDQNTENVQKKWEVFVNRNSRHPQCFNQIRAADLSRFCSRSCRRLWALFVCPLSDLLLGKHRWRKKKSPSRDIIGQNLTKKKVPYFVPLGTLSGTQQDKFETNLTRKKSRTSIQVEQYNHSTNDSQCDLNDKHCYFSLGTWNSILSFLKFW